MCGPGAYRPDPTEGITSPRERKRLWRLTRGLPQRRKVCEILEQVEAWCDRRCRTPTARDTLTKRRWRRHRFTPLGESLQTLVSPTLEQALVCRDDQWVPSTSQAVARGKRRYRQRQQSLSRVRTQAHLKARMALER